MPIFCELQKSVTASKYTSLVGNDELMIEVKIKFSVSGEG